jgi:hypothetical protein
MSGVAAGLLSPKGAGRSRAYLTGRRLMVDVGRVLNISVTGADEAARSLISGTLAQRVASAGLRAELRARAT